MMVDNILEVVDLKTYYNSSKGMIKAVDGVSFQVRRGERVGIVGESGSGKSTIALSILRLVTSSAKVEGKILLDGETDLLKSSEEELRRIRGKRIGTCFQDPSSYLNPVLKVGEQIAEVLRLHENLGKKEAWQKAVEVMGSVGIPSPEERAHNYAHEFSGGMKQRILIAEAICCKPDLILADEPTSDLDVLTQSEVLGLLRDLTTKMNSSLVLITHDLGIVAQLCDKVIVLYAGKISEEAETKTIFQNPKHPYTLGLMTSMTRLGRGKSRLQTMGGSVPSMINPPSGCRFHPRCKYVLDKCKAIDPEIQTITGSHRVACFRASEQLE
jgi:oligopeptide/dipeptide ABC transporter ATP-binding protein